MLQLLPPIGLVSLYSARAARMIGGAPSTFVAPSAAGGPPADTFAFVFLSTPL